jgi:hypothetical protein
MRWPLFVTLTMRNTSDLSSGAVRHLRRSFGKLRHRKFWKQRVVGGVATLEVTNIGNGWHPHLHAVIDCEWLSNGTRPPGRGSTKVQWEKACQQSATEIERHWSKCLGQETSSVSIMRANRRTIAKEVIKYSVKGSDLLECVEPVGEMIRAIDRCRMMTTFGNAHGQCVKDIRRAARESVDAALKEILVDLPPRCSCPEENLMPLACTEIALEERRQYERLAPFRNGPHDRVAPFRNGAPPRQAVSTC